MEAAARQTLIRTRSQQHELSSLIGCASRLRRVGIDVADERNLQIGELKSSYVSLWVSVNPVGGPSMAVQPPSTSKAVPVI